MRGALLPGMCLSVCAPQNNQPLPACLLPPALLPLTTTATGHIKIKAAREGVKPPLLATSGSADRDLETQLLKKGGGA